MSKPNFVLLALALTTTACGSDDGGSMIDPTQVRFGDTALVVVVNPAINDGNRHAVPAPGTARAGLVVSSDDGLTYTTGADGVAVLAPLTAGLRTIDVSGDGVASTFTIMLTAGALREVALATDGARAEIMVDLDYKSDRMFEVVPTMTAAEINDALKVSDRVVFFKTGTYPGDIDFSASRVTLFGEGVLGGTVNLQGNVTISGSDSRIRGTRISGTLAIPASGTGLSFSRVDGPATAAGSDTTLLANALCGGATVEGSGSIVLGNAGVAPTIQCP